MLYMSSFRVYLFKSDSEIYATLFLELFVLLFFLLAPNNFHNLVWSYGTYSRAMPIQKFG